MVSSLHSLISLYWFSSFRVWSGAIVGEPQCKKVLGISKEDLAVLAQLKSLRGLFSSGGNTLNLYACGDVESQDATVSNYRKLDSLQTAAEDAFLQAGVSVPIAAEDPSSFSQPSIDMLPSTTFYHGLAALTDTSTSLMPAFPDVSPNAGPNNYVESTAPTAFSPEPTGNGWKKIEPNAFEEITTTKPHVDAETNALAKSVYSSPEKIETSKEGEGEEGEGGESKEVEEEEKVGGEEGEGEGEEGGAEGAEGEEEEGAEEGEEEEEEFTPMDVGIGGMLLGSVAFVMVIFYFVNWQDDDIRRYSWSIISTTVSIFTAVLCFSGVNEFLMYLLEEFCELPRGGYIMVLISYTFFMVWFIVTEFAIGIQTGVWHSYINANLHDKVWVIANAMRYDYGTKMDAKFVRKPDAQKSIAVVNGVELFVHKRPIYKEQLHRRTVALRTLFSHMSGFAAIHAGGELQHMAWFSGNAYFALAAVMLNRFFLIFLFKVSERLHSGPEGEGKEEESDSGEEDPRAHCIELCLEETKEAENDIASLATSFLLIQAVRFWLTGVLPDNEGIQECGAPETKIILYLVAFGFGCMVIVILILHTGLTEKYRQLFILQNTMGMSLSWCLFWAARWMAEGNEYLKDMAVTPQTMAGRVFLALILSGVALVVILSLDVVEDKLEAAVGGGEVVGMIQNIINALSLLVGFAWEHCFEYSFEAIASITIQPLFTKLVFTVLVAALVAPAWRKYILVKVIQLKALQDEESKASAKNAGSELRGSTSNPELS